ncbi:MAG: signal recognition particle-docking protein FtsY [Desulfobacterales bacterium]|jgi:fused signal recognition particle receptor
MAFKWLRRKKDLQDAPIPEEDPDLALTEDKDATTEDRAEAPIPETQPEEADRLQEAAAEKNSKETEPLEDPAEAPPARGGFMSRLRRGLTKTRDILNTDIEDLFSGRRQIDDELLEELEELLITADIGVQTTMDLIDRISRKARKISTPEDLKMTLKDEILAIIDAAPVAVDRTMPTPRVIMVVGVNGVGKTTTIGKLAARYGRDGKKVLIAASDTFRAAAIEQLSIWAARAGADIVKHKDQADPAAVAFDAVEAAMARGTDIVLVDTAGRLHTKVNLMEELKKIKRSLSKKCAQAPHETLLVLDATTGQNALSQAKLFDEAIDLDALALTKLDGTAKGGIVVSICGTLNIPLKYIGVGEQIDDLQDFDPRQFVEALL